MYRDDSSSTNRPENAMVPAPEHSGDELMVHENGAGGALAMPGIAGMPAQDVLRGGMDANSFLHALRRRWILAFGMGLLVGGSSALALWHLFPESSSATAAFEILNEPQTVFTTTPPQSPAAFETLKKTQLASLRNYFVLDAAVRKPGVTSLSTLAGEDPIEWLQENLIVEYPHQGEILTISLSGDDPTEDYITLVNAVAKAYSEEVIDSARTRKLGTRDMLAKTLTNLNEEIKRKFDEYVDIAKAAERPQGNDGRDAKTELLLREIAEEQKRRSEITSQLYQMQTDYLVGKGQLQDPQLLEMQIEELLRNDPMAVGLEQQLIQAQMMQLQSSAGRPRGSRGGMDSQIAQLQASLDQYKSNFRKQKLREYKSKPNQALVQFNKDYKTRIGALQGMLNAINKSLEEKTAQLDKRTETVVDVVTRKTELDNLQDISNDMISKLESLDIELNAPAQIQQKHGAVPTKGINTAQHYSIAIIGGLAGFALTCFGIAYLEFRNRRLNAPDEVDEGLGIRVVGTLPALSSRKALDPNHPIVAQLTESIDGVRTILMHDSTAKKRQVVLVTSAATMEGRTTVASQLAASLARAGRRTLLIDGDLRRPALHSLFDVPLEDGLCEVLRAEVDVSDVIRPTHAEGLWLLTSGYCDIDAIHALATEQMQPVFDKLRAEYDFIIIDGAPVLGMSDALIFGQYSDGAILSVRRDHSQMPKINQAADLLRGVGIRIIGSVVNGVPAKADDRIIQMRLIAPKSERELQPTA